MGVCLAGYRGYQSTSSGSLFCVSLSLLDVKEAFISYGWLSIYSISTCKIPTWTTPLLVLLFVTALVPNTSFLGHLCSVGIGYICACYSSAPLRLHYSLCEPYFSRWSWLPQNPCTPGENPSLDRRQIEPPRSSSALRLNRPEDVWSIWRSAYYICVVWGSRGAGANLLRFDAKAWTLTSIMFSCFFSSKRIPPLIKFFDFSKFTLVDVHFEWCDSIFYDIYALNLVQQLHH